MAFKVNLQTFDKLGNFELPVLTVTIAVEIMKFEGPQQ